MRRSELASEVTGSVWKVLVKPGDNVAEGETLLICESMKMEIPIQAESGGRIVEVRVGEGDAVSDGDVVVVIES